MTANHNQKTGPSFTDFASCYFNRRDTGCTTQNPSSQVSHTSLRRERRLSVPGWTQRPFAGGRILSLQRNRRAICESDSANAVAKNCHLGGGGVWQHTGQSAVAWQSAPCVRSVGLPRSHSEFIGNALLLAGGLLAARLLPAEIPRPHLLAGCSWHGWIAGSLRLDVIDMVVES